MLLANGEQSVEAPEVPYEHVTKESSALDTPRASCAPSIQALNDLTVVMNPTITSAPPPR